MRSRHNGVRMTDNAETRMTVGLRLSSRNVDGSQDGGIVTRVMSDVAW